MQLHESSGGSGRFDLVNLRHVLQLGVIDRPLTQELFNLLHYNFVLLLRRDVWVTAVNQVLDSTKVRIDAVVFDEVICLFSGFLAFPDCFLLRTPFLGNQLAHLLVLPREAVAHAGDCLVQDRL